MDDRDRVPPDPIQGPIYEALRTIASRELHRDRNPGRLEPTDLVHECYLKLARLETYRDMERAHFLAAAASLIRQVLVDHARAEGRAKRGAGWRRITLSESYALTGSDELALEDLDGALRKLERLDPRQSRLVELRFFGGLSMTEAADIVGVSRRTATEEWRMARAWLRRELQRVLE